MNGFTLKAALFILAFLLPSLTFATNASNSTEIYRTSLGCMACHQAEAMQTEQLPKKRPQHKLHQHSVKNAIQD